MTQATPAFNRHQTTVKKALSSVNYGYTSTITSNNLFIIIVI